MRLAFPAADARTRSALSPGSACLSLVRVRVPSGEGVVCGRSTVTTQPRAPLSQRPFLSTQQAASCSEPFSSVSLTTPVPWEGGGHRVDCPRCSAWHVSWLDAGVALGVGARLRHHVLPSTQGQEAQTPSTSPQGRWLWSCSWVGLPVPSTVNE